MELMGGIFFEPISPISTHKAASFSLLPGENEDFSVANNIFDVFNDR